MLILLSGNYIFLNAMNIFFQFLAREDRNDMFAGKMLDKSFFMNDDVDLEWVAISEKVQVSEPFIFCLFLTYSLETPK